MATRIKTPIVIKSDFLSFIRIPEKKVMIYPVIKAISKLKLTGQM
jgi:hypothetical protein